MLRGLNSVYTQALLPQTASEKKTFAGYILALCHMVEHHHAAVASRFRFN